MFRRRHVGLVDTLRVSPCDDSQSQELSRLISTPFILAASIRHGTTLASTLLALGQYAHPKVGIAAPYSQMLKIANWELPSFAFAGRSTGLGSLPCPDSDF